jgi:cytochrome P450
MTLDDIDIANPDAYLGGVPHDQFALLRREAPVFRHREANGPGFWALTRHADIARVARDQTTFRQAPALFIEDLPAGNLRDSPDVMINMDPPRHTRYRALVSKGLTPRIIQRLEGHVRDVVTELIDGFAARGTADFVQQFASELPMRMIVELMGVPARSNPRCSISRCASSAPWIPSTRAVRRTWTHSCGISRQLPTDSPRSAAASQGTTC